MTLPTEHAEQVALVQEFERRYPEVRILSVPNGGQRHKTVAMKLKAEGVSKGVPDLFIPEWRMWIEMKRQNGGRVSPDQKDWMEYLEQCGYTCIVARGAADALEQIEKNRP